MFPRVTFLGLDLYTLFMMAGVILCMILIRLQADWRGLRARLQNLLLLNTVAAVVLGYGCAVLLQAFYNYKANGTFEIASDTGATFYGGLIGGTALFIIIYFVVGRFLYPDGYHVKQFRTVSEIAPACITVAHGFGRLGCLMAGCCYGRACPADAWYGIYMEQAGGTVIPVQLYEALFLLSLSAIFLFLFKKKKPYLLPSYMITYALWRFVAEYLRDDYRGETVVDFLTPSQLISVLLLAGGLLLLGIELFIDHRTRQKQAAEGEGTAPEAGYVPVTGVAPADETSPADTREADTDETTSGETDQGADL